jgi:serine/threonine protein kinase
MNDRKIKRGTKIAGFEVLSYLSSGNTGAVYKAHQTSLNRHVALKVLHPEVAADPDFLRGFFREARSAAAINHSNIVQAYDVGEADGYHFLAMELIDAGDCRQLVDKQGPLQPKQALEIIRAVADGLSHGFQFRGLTHGDLKPANILLTSEGKPKLADLGLARMNGDNDSSEGIELTPDFAAPEVITGKWQPGDPRADIYSLGATFYYLIAGHPVFQGESYKDVLQMHQFTPPPSLNIIVPTCSVAIAKFAARMLAKSPDERFAGWPELLEEIDKLLNVRAPKIKSVHVLPHRIHQPSDIKRSTGYIIGLIAAGLAAGLLFLLVAAPSSSIKNTQPKKLSLGSTQCLMMEKNGTEVREFSPDAFGPSTSPGIKACLDFANLPPISPKPYVLKIFLIQAGTGLITIKDATGLPIAESSGGESGQWLSIAIPRPLQPSYDGKIRLVLTSTDQYRIDCSKQKPCLEIGP